MPAWTARGLAEAVRSGQVSAVQTVRERRARADRLADLHIFTATDWVRAERTAAAIDERRGSGHRLGRLAGVPFSVKDVVAVADLPLTAGSRAFADHRAGTTAPAVQRLIDEDAILIGKTNCPEFALDMTCGNDLFGETGNPAFPGYSPGGSSGGEAAALSAGISTLGVGTDFGGSVRWPAQCTGVVAIRPTAGRIDPTGQIPGLGGDMAGQGRAAAANSTLQGQSQVIGPMATTVDDLRLMISVMDPRPPMRPSTGPLRIGWSAGRNIGPVRAEVANLVAAAAAALADLGWPTEELDRVFDGCLSAYNRLRAVDPMRDHQLAVRGREHLLSERLLEVIDDSTKATAADRIEARGAANRARRAALTVFAGVDVVLLPVAAGPACRPDGTLDVDGVAIGRWAVMAHCRAVTLTGTPAVSVPVGISVEGLPLSVQVIGRPGEDETALRVAGVLEHWWGRPNLPVHPNWDDRR